MTTASPSKVAGWTSRWLTEELKSLSRTGDWAGAVSVLQQTESSNLVHHNVFHYTTAIDACCRAGELQTAFQLFSKMKDLRISPNVYTYTSLIHGCARAERPNTALRLFAEMRLREVPPNVKTMTALISALAKSGQWQKCFAIIDEAEELLIAPNVMTYTAAMEACRQAGVCKPALRCLDTRMRNPMDVRPNQVTYNTALGACVAAGEAEAAVRVYAAMAADGYYPLPYTRELLTEVFRGTSREGLADDLQVHERPTKWEMHKPDSDPLTVARALQESEEEEEDKR